MAFACIVLGRQCIMNDRDPMAIEVTARDTVNFIQFLQDSGNLVQLGAKPTWNGKDPFAAYFQHCDGKPVRLDEHGLPQDGNAPLGWPKKGNMEEINRFLESTDSKL